MKDKWLWGTGIFAGLLGALCCIGPVAGVLLGVGSAAWLLGMHQYNLIFAVFGFLLLAGVSWFAVYKRRQCCAVKSWAQEAKMVITIFAVGILSYGVLQGAVVPALSQSLMNRANGQASQTSSGSVETASLTVVGMTCAGCAAAVQQALLDEDGMVSADVNSQTGAAVVQYQSSKTDAKKIRSIDLPQPFKIVDQKTLNNQAKQNQE